VNKNKPRNILPDCIIPTIALGFTVYYLTTITEVPWISQASAIVVSMLLLASVIAFAVRSYIRVRSGEEILTLAGLDFSAGGTNIKRLLLLAFAIAYIWLIDDWGFTLTTFIFIFLGIVVLSSLANWKNALLIALTCSATGYIVFIYFFKTRFPSGPIENWLAGVL